MTALRGYDAARRRERAQTPKLGGLWVFLAFFSKAAKNIVMAAFGEDDEIGF